MASGGRSSTAKSSKNKAKTTAVKKNTSPAGKSVAIVCGGCYPAFE